MATANLILIKDEQTTQNRARAAIEAYSVKSVERIDRDRFRFVRVGVSTWMQFWRARWQRW